MTISVMDNLERAADELIRLFYYSNESLKKAVSAFISAMKQYKAPTETWLPSGWLFAYTRQRTLPKEEKKALLKEVDLVSIVSLMEPSILNELIIGLTASLTHDELCEIFISNTQSTSHHQLILKYAPPDVLLNILDQKIVSHQLINEILEKISLQDLLGFYFTGTNLNEFKIALLNSVPEKERLDELSKRISDQSVLALCFNSEKPELVLKLVTQFLSEGGWTSTSANIYVMTEFCRLLENEKEKDVTYPIEMLKRLRDIFLAKAKTEDKLTDEIVEIKLNKGEDVKDKKLCSFNEMKLSTRQSKLVAERGKELEAAIASHGSSKDKSIEQEWQLLPPIPNKEAVRLLIENSLLQRSAANNDRMQLIEEDPSLHLIEKNDEQATLTNQEIQRAKFEALRADIGLKLFGLKPSSNEPPPLPPRNEPPPLPPREPLVFSKK